MWKYAEDPLRCWIGLGLNCGLYAIDLSDLRTSELIERDGVTYLARRRSKTAAPGRWKLWPVTVALIERVREDRADGRLFATDRGKTLVVETPKATSDHVAREMVKLSARADTKACFSMLRDTGAEFVEAWGRREGGNIVTSAYLSHADSRMARNYLTSEPADLATGRLDEVTDVLNEFFNLTP